MIRIAGLFVFALFMFSTLAPQDAGAVVRGTSSGLGSHTVKIVRRGQLECTGVAIARNLVVTASHCLTGGAHVQSIGATVGIAGRSRSATTDTGVRVGGGAVILRLRRPLSAAAPIAIGDGRVRGSATIAGYGTVNEDQPGASGALHQARLVPARGRQLVDPQRRGKIGASACFGDSGGPVVSGGRLVGIVTRANHPGSRKACGFYTRWTPVSAHGRARIAARDTANDDSDIGTPTSARPLGLFGLFNAEAAPKAERVRKHRRRAHRKWYRRRHTRRHWRR